MRIGKKKSLKGKYISIGLLLLWMIVIFVNSAQNGDISSKESHFVTDKVVALIKKTSPKAAENVDKVDHFVRKNGHAFEYLVLAILASNLFRCFGRRPKEVFITILFICLLYAVSDEFHQSFVIGRSSMVSDVLIDFGGSFVGTILYYFIWAIRIK